jgi:TolB-like protein
MFKKLQCCVLFTVFFLGCSTTEKIPPKQPILCSILSFESRAGMKTGEAESVADMFAGALQNSQRFTVIERNQLNAIVKEQEFQSAQSEDGTAKAAKILAISKMFSGSVGMLGEDYVVSVKMIDVESSRVDYSHSWTYDDDLEDINEEFLPNIVREILLAIDGVQKK